MTKTNMPKLLLGTSVLAIFVGLVFFSVGGTRFLDSAVAQHTPIPQANQSMQKQQPDAAIREVQKFEARFPKTDYDAAEPTNPEEKAKRKNKNKHWDGKNLVMRNPSSSGSATTEMDEVFKHLPALPVVQSDVILTADVVNSGAHLSNDKTGVYSEFNVQVDTVLKGNLPVLSQTKLISVSRFGGMVRYPSGHRELYGIAAQNMPAIGKRYLFFLKTIEDTQDYEIVTGYEIREGVLPLDYLRQFAAYKGTDSTTFLNVVRDAIASQK